MTDINNSEQYLVLRLDLTVPKWLFDSVLQLVIEIAPGVDPSKEYTLEMLCGEEFWKPLSDWHRRLAGQCMVYMVEQERVPFCFAGHRCESQKKYMLR
jgi:hypothetical protein